MEIMSLILFTVIDIFIAIFLGYRYEMMYSEVKETKRLSIGVMAIHQTGKRIFLNSSKDIDATPYAATSRLSTNIK